MSNLGPGTRIEIPEAPPAPQAPPNQGVKLPGKRGFPLDRDSSQPKPPPIVCPGKLVRDKLM